VTFGPILRRPPHLAQGSLDGGFWGLVGPLLPALTITQIGTFVEVCWPSPSTGFSLEQSTGLQPTAWFPVAQVPSDNGITKCVILPASSSTTFYRLSNP
jgi:hypothetical protein